MSTRTPLYLVKPRLKHQIGDTHTNRFGMTSTVLVWRGVRDTCGHPFEATSSRAAKSLNRICPAHVTRGRGVDRDIYIPYLTIPY